MPGILLLIIFIGVPLAEIALFVTIGGQIGLLATIAVVIITAICGTYLLRWQGFAVLQEARRATDAGEMPVRPVVDGVFLLIAGVLLLTPGFLTDTIGFLLFVPAIRRSVGSFIWNRLMASGSVTIVAERTTHRSAEYPHPGGDTIEAEYADVTENSEPDGERSHEQEQGPIGGGARKDTPWRP
jgi:UPF0716 protein FxsA